MQLGDAAFLFSALFWDLLIIRVCLLVAYVFLLTAAATGYPNWGSLDNPGYISLDGIVWVTTGGGCLWQQPTCGGVREGGRTGGDT